MPWGPLHRGPLLLLLVLGACAQAEAPPPPAAPPAPVPRSAAPDARRLEVVVKRVVDGDTLRVSGLAAGTGLVRLTGIDAPETGDGRTTRECFGPEARRWLGDRAPAGTRLTLVLDVGERDRFGRLLAYAYRADGAFLNAELVENGYARTMTIRPNVAHAKELQALERAARRGGRGLWSACPSDGRRREQAPNL